MSGTEHSGTLVIGGGQAGLAMGHALAERGEEYLILEARRRPGDSWRERWDSLRLFTPAEHDGLPGMRFPAAAGTYPAKDDMAAYLERYAAAFGLAVRHGCEALAMRRNERGWVVTTSGGTLTAAAVVVATGTNPRPSVPAFAGALAPEIVQLHSAEYRSPVALPDGEVLVVGAGTSGAQIALELAGTHPVTIAGRPTVHIPDAVLRHAGGAYWFLVHRVLTRNTPPGRKAAAGFTRRGAPLISVSMGQLRDAGVSSAGRVRAVTGGWPVLADGTTVHPSVVVWATGYRPDYDWIDTLACAPDGWPVHRRGVAVGAPGLYFLGIPFQYALTSGLIGGVGRDARYIADRIRADRTGADRIGAGARTG